jgi:hypothetical protein
MKATITLPFQMGQATHFRNVCLPSISINSHPSTLKRSALLSTIASCHPIPSSMHRNTHRTPSPTKFKPSKLNHDWRYPRLGPSQQFEIPEPPGIRVNPPLGSSLKPTPARVFDWLRLWRLPDNPTLYERGVHPFSAAALAFLASGLAERNITSNVQSWPIAFEELVSEVEKGMTSKERQDAFAGFIDDAEKLLWDAVCVFGPCVMLVS